MNRELQYSDDFKEFLNGLDQRSFNKIDYCLFVLQRAMPLTQKFVKKVVCSDFYELRVSVNNEIRVILFAVDNENISLATKILVLNAFIKKSNKDYDKNIMKAYNILNTMR